MRHSEWSQCLQVLQRTSRSSWSLILFQLCTCTFQWCQGFPLPAPGNATWLFSPWRYHCHPLNPREHPFVRWKAAAHLRWEARSVSASALSITFWRLLVDFPRQVEWLTDITAMTTSSKESFQGPSGDRYFQPTTCMHARLKWNKHG